MKTIKESFEKEIVIQKSRFIGIIRPLKSKEDVKIVLADIQKKYPKATHYCYGYIFEGAQKSNDDGEPSGTAGRPILETMIRNDLFNCIIVVVRYFGGIKLGAGGLLRAYIDSSVSVINESELFEEEERKIYEAIVSYEHNEVLKNYLIKNQIDILDTIYDDKIKYLLSSNIDFESDLCDYMQGKISLGFIENKKILVKVS